MLEKSWQTSHHVERSSTPVCISGQTKKKKKKPEAKILCLNFTTNITLWLFRKRKKKLCLSLDRIMKSGPQIRFQTVEVPAVLLVLRQSAPHCKRWQSSHGPWGSKANSWSVGACLFCNDLNLPINILFSSEAHINIVLIACQLLGPN